MTLYAWEVNDLPGNGATFIIRTDDVGGYSAGHNALETPWRPPGRRRGGGGRWSIVPLGEDGARNITGFPFAPDHNIVTA